ncbi:MAG: motility associated factor glycosyltransferase family protein [Simkania sp.]|nr:motility associated factor glycosyltransferase family protein [Simkania sp.]MCB1075020.1 motility associated factor glycosyltransferase family protein [Simkania sp.]MCP5489503.1 motility associated factor glycosyltransferase family protein [Chlamydiales bacterium]
MSRGLSLLEERFPQLCFLLSILQGEPWIFCERGKNAKRKGLNLYREERIKEEISEKLGNLRLDEIEVLYIYGMGLGHYATPLLDWLAQDVKRDLVFLEHDIEVLRIFLETKQAEALIKHPQIHFRFLLEPKNWKSFFEERANEFPYEKAEFIALESYQKMHPRRIASMRLHLMRRTTVHHAIHMDEMFYHVLSKNVLANFSRIDQAFYANKMGGAFKGIPAIICGAGPSLQDELEHLRKLEDQALIFAGGSAITGLSQAGILPHFGVAIDPNFEEVHRFRKSLAFEVPLLYTNRLHPEVFDTFNGPHGYIHAMTGGPLELWWEKEIGIEPLPLQGGFDIEALSVTTTCLEIATTMGCDPIILVGVDLAFTGNSLYAAGIVNESKVSLKDRDQDMRAPERLLKRKDRQGKPIHTLVKWVMESEAIGNFAKKNPQTSYLNCTSGGIGFPGLPYQPLAQQSFSQSYDLRGKIHQLIETRRFSFTKPNPLEKVKDSLFDAQDIVAEALEELKRVQGRGKDPETGRMIFYQMELEEQLAFALCLQQPALTFQKTYNRLHRFSIGEATHDQKWHWLHSKWKSFNDLITYYLESSFTK